MGGGALPALLAAAAAALCAAAAVSGAECVRCPRCPPPPARCRYNDSSTRDEHYYIVDDVWVCIWFRDGYLRLECPAGVTLDSASLPRFERRALVASVVVVRCAAPRAGYARALAALNVAPPDRLELAAVPRLPPLRAHHLAGLPRLRALQLSAAAGADPLEPEPALLEPLEGLRKLFATRVRLAPALGRLPRALTDLSLVDCALRELPAAALARLPALERLTLWDRTVAAPPPLLAAPALRSFNVVAPLVEMPPIDHLENVSLVNVLDLRLAGACGALRRLTVTSAPAAALPARWLHNCTGLRELWLSGLRVTALPPTLLGGAPALQRLVVARCRRLAALPAALFDAARDLRSLELTHTALAALPDDIFAPLRGLRELDLSHNRLAGAGAARALLAAGALASLRRLKLDHNELGDVCGDTPGGAGAGTGTDHDELSPLRELRELRSLSLAHTGGSRLCADWRRDLKDLAHIDYSFNNLTELKYADMQWYGVERVVELDGNPLAGVTLRRAQYERAPQDAPHLARAALRAAAALRCDCTTYWAARALREGRLRASLGELTCGDVPLDRAPLDRMTCEERAACPRNCTCVLRPHDDTLALACAGAAPDLRRAAARAPRLELRLDGLTDLPPDLRLPPALRLLDLSRSRLGALPPAAARALFEHSRSVLLAGNPLACECDAAGARPALLRELLAHAPLVPDLGDVRCADGSRASETPPCAAPAPSRAWLGGAAAVALGAALALALGAALARRSSRLRVKAFLLARGICARWARPDDKDDCKYDAFISFSHHDNVIAEQIISQLESGPRPLRLCVHYRDWRAGDFIPAQIARSVRQSRRTVVLVSEHFARSAWARAEFREAAARALRDAEPRLLVVLLAAAPPAGLDAELRHYIRTNTYVRWGEPAFWDRLRLALPPGRPRAAPAPAPRPDARPAPAPPPPAPPAPAPPTAAAPPTQHPAAPPTQHPAAPPTPIIKFSQMDFPHPTKKNTAVTSPCA